MNAVRVRRLATRDDGGALVELAFALPVLVIIFAITIDFARVFYEGINLSNAARAGAQWGSYSRLRSSNYPMMESTAVGATNLSGVTATATRNCQCATDDGVFSATSPANDCSSPEATACASGHRVTTITVVTSKTFTPLMVDVPFIPDSIGLTRSATLRVPQ
jgi:Flp pilus assembly protein TadG